MAMLTVRNVSDEVHRALRVRAALHGHSMEAEVRGILESVVSPQGRVKLGSLLADMAGGPSSPMRSSPSSSRCAARSLPAR